MWRTNINITLQAYSHSEEAKRLKNLDNNIIFETLRLYEALSDINLHTSPRATTRGRKSEQHKHQAYAMAEQVRHDAILCTLGNCKEALSDKVLHSKEIISSLIVTPNYYSSKLEKSVLGKSIKLNT